MSTVMWFVFLSHALIFLMPNAVQSYGTGAPCVAQHNLQPSLIFHGTTQNLLSNPPPYTFAVENEEGKPVKSYTVGKVYTIHITAKNHFRGFLLQPRVASKEKNLIGTLRAGEFISDDTWESQGIQYQPCQPKTHDSITHTNNEKKTRLTVKWKTSQNVGPVQFYLTLVAEQSIFWEGWQPETGYLTSGEGNKDASKVIETVAKDAEPASTTTDSAKRKAKRPKTSSEDRSEGSDLRESSGSKETSTSKKQTETPSITSTESISTKKPTSNDPCAENECKNGASCRINGTSYSCNCAEGYVGKFCQWQCPSYLCQNGGTCSIDQSSNYVCACVEGFTGNHCEESKTKSTKAPKTTTTVTSSDEITTIPPKKDKDTSKSSTVKASKQSGKGSSSSSSKSNSKEGGDNFDPASLLRSGGSAPPDETQQSENTKNEKPSKSNDAHSPSKEIKAILRENGGNDTSGFDDPSTTEEPIPTTTVVPVNPFIERLVSKLLDSNNAVYTNGLHDIKNPDPCEDNQCTNGGECIADKADKNGYICKCHGEYDGPFCQWDCPAYLCRNGGSCFIDDSFNYLCTCKQGYVGPHCETKNFTEPESANATSILFSLKHLFSGDSSAEQLIDDTFNHTVEKFDTTILKELSSNHIDSKKRLRFIKAANLNKNATELINILVEPDYCASIYCYNDGSCLRNVTGKTGYCNCTEGWTGDNCDKKDFCYDNKCDHNSRCINGDSNYTCQCKGEFAGRFCSIACPPTLCSNHGKCFYDENKYKCTCKPGYTGDRCQIEIDECEVKPCQNGGTCIDKLNGYECKCPEGFMGSKCHRPCQDVYKNHCSVWKREDRCESTGTNVTNFFAVNCALSCGLCVKAENTTSSADILIPPSLEPLDFLIGKWFVNSSDPKHFPFDYVKTTNGYYEELEISPGDILLFGIPALNYSSIATGNDNSTEVLARAGFLSYRLNGTNQNVTLMSVGNDGLTLMEEGELNSGNEIIMTTRFVNIASSVEQRIPVAVKRSLAISGVYLRESLERRYNDSTTDYYTKYYSKKVALEVY